MYLGLYLLFCVFQIILMERLEVRMYLFSCFFFEISSSGILYNADVELVDREVIEFLSLACISFSGQCINS